MHYFRNSLTEDLYNFFCCPLCSLQSQQDYYQDESVVQNNEDTAKNNEPQIEPTVRSTPIHTHDPVPELKNDRDEQLERYI
jgi:hypothetical protein